jgi:hypothetical protein
MNRSLYGLTRPGKNRCRLVQIQEATWTDFTLQQAIAHLSLDRDAKSRPWLVPPELDRGDGARPDHAVTIARRPSGSGCDCSPRVVFARLVADAIIAEVLDRFSRHLGHANLHGPREEATGPLPGRLAIEHSPNVTHR